MVWFATDFSLVGGLARRVLIVEDDPSSLKALSRILTMAGYEVLCAATLERAAIQLVRQPDFVLLDLMLPDGIGLDFLSRIRRRDETALVAVISAAPGELIGQAAQLGADAIFPKPLDLPALLQWLKNPIPQSLKPPVVHFLQPGQ